MESERFFGAGIGFIIGLIFDAFLFWFSSELGIPVYLSIPPIMAFVGFFLQEIK